MVDSPEWVHVVGQDAASVLRIVPRGVDRCGCLSIGLIPYLGSDS